MFVDEELKIGHFRAEVCHGTVRPWSGANVSIWIDPPSPYSIPRYMNSPLSLLSVL